jgi:acetyl-CoA acyltransferase
MKLAFSMKSCLNEGCAAKLFDEMRRRTQKYGMVTMCVGTGQGEGSAFELLN